MPVIFIYRKKIACFFQVKLYYVRIYNTCPIFLCQVQEAYCERYHERIVALLDSFGEATKKFHTAVSHSRASMLYESPVSRCRIHEFAAPILNHSTPRALWGVDRTERQRGKRRKRGGGVSP